MEESKFFRFVWRFNALVLMATGGILATGVLAFAVTIIFRDVTKERNTRDIVNVQEESNVQQKWQLGYMSTIQGSPYVMIPLNSNQSSAQSYYSKSPYHTRNYLFINSQNNEKHWLFSTNQYLVVANDLLSEKEYGSNESEVRAILYRIIKSDTNNEKRLTDNDIQTIGISLPSGKGYKEILGGIDLFVGQRLIDKDTLLVVFQRRGVGYSATVNLPGFTISDEAELPRVSH